MGFIAATRSLGQIIMGSQLWKNLDPVPLGRIRKHLELTIFTIDSGC